MSSNERLQRYRSISPSHLNVDSTQFDNWCQLDPFPYGQSPTCDFDDFSELPLDKSDSMCSDTLSSSSWAPQTTDYVTYHEESLFQLDNPMVLRGGSIGQGQPKYNSYSPSPSAIQIYGQQFESSIRGERGRGIESQFFKCSECCQVFDTLQSLEQHTKKELHKIWRCTDSGCGKAYPRRDTLARHQLKHSDKGHVCSICQQNNKQKVFKRRDHLAEHVRKRHALSTDDISQGKPRKYKAIQGIVKSLEAVLGEGHHILQGLESTITTMSNSEIESVAVTIAERIAQVAADPDKG